MIAAGRRITSAVSVPVTIDFEADDETGDLKLKGPYIGAILRF